MPDEATALAALAQASQAAKAAAPSSAPGVITDSPDDYTPLDAELYASLVAEMNACADQHTGFLLAVSWQDRSLSGPDVAMAGYARERLPKAVMPDGARSTVREIPSAPPAIKLFAR